MSFGGLLNDDAEDVTDLNLQIETAGVPSIPHADEETEPLARALPLAAALASADEPLPADEERPTALVAPDTLRREIERSRNATDPTAAEPPPPPRPPLTTSERQRPIVTPSEPFVLSGAAQVETLMASSLHMGRHELPTAPAPFPVVKIDAGAGGGAEAPSRAGSTVVIPKSTLDEVLGPRGPKGTAKMLGAPDAAPLPVALPAAATPPAAAPAAGRLAAEPTRSPRRGSRMALALLVIVAAVAGAMIGVYLLGAPRH